MLPEPRVADPRPLDGDREPEPELLILSEEPGKFCYFFPNAFFPLFIDFRAFVPVNAATLPKTP